MADQPFPHASVQLAKKVGPGPAVYVPADSRLLRVDSSGRTPRLLLTRKSAHSAMASPGRPRNRRGMGVSVRSPSDPSGELMARVRHVRAAAGICCPRCDSSRVQRWGRSHGRQRYRCGDCRRTFNDLTGTALAYAKKLDRWDAYLDCMKESVTLREAAGEVGVHPSTAFRWRHRVLAAVRESDTPALEGWVELASLWFHEARKGQPIPDRPARKRASHIPWIPAREGVNVAVAADRTGHVAMAVAGMAHSRRIEVAALARVLGSAIREATVITAQHGHVGPARDIERLLHVPFIAARGGTDASDPETAHACNALLASWRLRAWLKRFRGVSTRYLDHYLSWFVTLQKAGEAADRSFRTVSRRSATPGW